MKKLFLCAITLAFLLVSRAQDAAPVPEPEFINQVFLLKDQKLMSLEKADAQLKSKSKFGGMGGVKQMYVIDGVKSSVSIPESEMMFVVSTGGSGFSSDPSSQFQLLRFEGKKNKREALSGEYGGGITKKSNEETSEVEMNFKKLKEGVFGMVPSKALEKGEYAFINRISAKQSGMTMKMEAFAFSVD
jgi:hypothetical protein